jgi:pimeloyl-ACP methyl ester carboxylesterase
MLEAKGHVVLAPDLPGHGNDSTASATVTLQSYADRICQIANAQSEPVILAGHSMGGVAITQAAENCPKQIRALAYVSAFLPSSGDSLMTWAAQDRESMVNPSTMAAREDGSFDFKLEHSREAFYGDCATNDVEFAQSHLSCQPSTPLATPVQTSREHWGRIPRYYVECLRDRAITLELQRAMQKNSPCQQTFYIDTDHSPFFSTPEQLADVLSQIALA